MKVLKITAGAEIQPSSPSTISENKSECHVSEQIATVSSYYKTLIEKSLASAKSDSKRQKTTLKKTPKG
jgi:hypothetical protein